MRLELMTVQLQLSCPNPFCARSHLLLSSSAPLWERHRAKRGGQRIWCLLCVRFSMCVPLRRMPSALASLCLSGLLSQCVSVFCCGGVKKDLRFLLLFFHVVPPFASKLSFIAACAFGDAIPPPHLHMLLFSPPPSPLPCPLPLHLSPLSFDFFFRTPSGECPSPLFDSPHTL